MTKKAILIIIATILFLSLIIFYRFWPSKNTFSSEPKTIIPTKALSLNDLYLYAQKNKAMENISNSQVYFSAVKKELNPKTYRLDIYLSAREGMKVDGADLVLSYESNIVINQIIKGQVFPQYPRLLAEDNQIYITGLASLAGNTIKLGQPNKIFVSLIVAKKETSKPAILNVNQTDTKAFLNGEPVLNLELSFNQIVL